MSEEGKVIRAATSDEKKDFIEIGKRGRKLSYKDATQRKIRELETKYHSELKPYDRYSALLELQDALDIFVKEYQRNVDKQGKSLEVSLKENGLFDDKILNSYGDKSRFKLIYAKKINTEKILDGIKQTVQDKMEVEFAATRGNRVTFQMTNAEYEEMYAPVEEKVKVNSPENKPISFPSSK